MSEKQSAKIYLFPTKPRRGRPHGSAKSSAKKIRDRVRTVATLDNLYRRLTTVNNLGQFSRWFDEQMHRIYPGRNWDTATSNKWRKNFAGNVAMTQEWLEYLQGLFSDNRYYVDADSSLQWWDTQPAYPLKASNNPLLSARVFFEEGPARLWLAVWRQASHPDELWDIYPPGDMAWGIDCFSAAVDDLEMRLYCNFDTNMQITEEDLGRAVVLYRMQLEGWYGNQTCNSPEYGVRLYLCLKLALAMSFAMPLESTCDIAAYFAFMEHSRTSNEPNYALAVEACGIWENMPNASDVGSYVTNPFWSLSERASTDLHARRYETLAMLTDRYLRHANKRGVL